MVELVLDGGECSTEALSHPQKTYSVSRASKILPTQDPVNLARVPPKCALSTLPLNGIAIILPIRNQNAIDEPVHAGLECSVVPISLFWLMPRTFLPMWVHRSDIKPDWYPDENK